MQRPSEECVNVHENTELYLQDKLTEGEQNRIVEHLSTCEVCRTTVESRRFVLEEEDKGHRAYR